MNCGMSVHCEAPDHEPDAGEENPGLDRGDGGLELLGEAEVAVEPREGAFDPSPWQDLEALGHKAPTI